MDYNVLNDISYGMYIISTRYNNRYIGCFVNTVTQITAQNPIISISVNKNNYTSEALSIGNRFGVSILSKETDSQIIGKFGFFSSREIDKFEDVSYKNVEGIPIITERVCGYLICEVINVVDAETHNIILARVIDTNKENDIEPMTYSYYHKVIKGRAPESAPTYRADASTEIKSTNKYKCKICGYIYDDGKEKIKFEDLPDDWKCPLCGVGKEMFEKI